MAPFKSFNFFIGPNNSGKSAVLNFLRDYVPIWDHRHTHRPNFKLDPLDSYDAGVSGAQWMAIGIPVKQFEKKLRENSRQGYTHPSIDAALNSVLGILQVREHIWFGGNLPINDDLYLVNKMSAQEWATAMNPKEWSLLRDLITPTITSYNIESLIEEIFRKMQRGQLPGFPEVRHIPAVREIGTQSLDDKDYSGRGLILKLAQIQNPDPFRRGDAVVFEKINNFIRSVTDKESARIEIPHHREYIMVHMDGRVLPLHSLGTGIHEVIMIAAYCTLAENNIVCIEEPEIHLHPILQRKLIKYLKDNTNNQYFIATHSASFIDTPGAAIFQVTHDGVQTYIEESILASHRHNICALLGYRASDIVQSNSVIWVEGPTELLYLRHWIGQIDPDLIEGIHYSIMFYGGRLLSHLSADDFDVGSFIDLRALNRNIAIIMDSDKEAPDSPINSTKQRVASEIVGASGVAWITAGREIENYINYDQLQEAVKACHSGLYHKPDKGGRYDHALYFRRSELFSQDGRPKSYLDRKVDKVGVARLVCAQPTDFSVLDLKERVEEIVGMIRAANTH